MCAEITSTNGDKYWTMKDEDLIQLASSNLAQLGLLKPEEVQAGGFVKRVDYAEAGIPEYWIVNPEEESITVLTLDDDSYREHGVFRRGSAATSLLLQGFVVDVNVVLDAS